MLSEMILTSTGNRISNMVGEFLKSTLIILPRISVLKGPSAAALYGSRAANGVILVTTKSGSGSKKGIGAEVNFSATFEDPLVKPKFQNTYGGGSGYYLVR